MSTRIIVNGEPRVVDAAADTPLLYAAVRCAALDLLKRNARRARREERVALEADDSWWDADTLGSRETCSDH